MGINLAIVSDLALVNLMILENMKQTERLDRKHCFPRHISIIPAAASVSEEAKYFNKGTSKNKHHVRFSHVCFLSLFHCHPTCVFSK